MRVLLYTAVLLLIPVLGWLLGIAASAVKIMIEEAVANNVEINETLTNPLQIWSLGAMVYSVTLAISIMLVIAAALRRKHVI